MIQTNVTYYVCPNCRDAMFFYGPQGVKCARCGTVKFKREVAVLKADSIETEPAETYFERLLALNVP